MKKMWFWIMLCTLALAFGGFACGGDDDDDDDGSSGKSDCEKLCDALDACDWDVESSCVADCEDEKDDDDVKCLIKCAKDHADDCDDFDDCVYECLFPDDTDTGTGTGDSSQCPGQSTSCIMCNPNPPTDCSQFEEMGSNGLIGCCGSGNAYYCLGDPGVGMDSCGAAGCCFGTWQGNPAHVCCGQSS